MREYRCNVELRAPTLRAPASSSFVTFEILLNHDVYTPLRTRTILPRERADKLRVERSSLTIDQTASVRARSYFCLMMAECFILISRLLSAEVGAEADNGHRREVTLTADRFRSKRDKDVDQILINSPVLVISVVVISITHSPLLLNENIPDTDQRCVLLREARQNFTLVRTVVVHIRLPRSWREVKCAISVVAGTNDTAEKYARERKEMVKDDERGGRRIEDEEEEFCTRGKEAEMREGRLLRKVECECADAERTPNRLLEVNPGRLVAHTREEEEGGRLGGYTGKASQPAVETVSSPAAPGAAGKTRCWDGEGPWDVGRRRRQRRGKDERKQRGRGVRGPRGARRERCLVVGQGGKVGAARRDLLGMSEWADSTHSKDFPPRKLRCVYGIHTYRVIQKRWYPVVVVAFSGIVTITAIGESPASTRAINDVIISDFGLRNWRGEAEHPLYRAPLPPRSFRSAYKHIRKMPVDTFVEAERISNSRSKCSVRRNWAKIARPPGQRNWPPGILDTNYTWIQQSVTFHVDFMNWYMVERWRERWDERGQIAKQ
ncbi:hypothetical protein DBV15_06926 [Temnothorax longispinosus]|uniref:Uncharacterized protein n=1 Tax=Temnothorax longispinosus TaxID=300112 RepID=A0A4S2KRK9_9HYME|nr:hypothetical protein DBV15_06926 [Temnothorax longispinosus]